MKKIILQVFAVFLLSTSISYAQSVFEKNIYFNSAEYSLDESYHSELSSLLNEIQTYSEYSIKVIGHTDQDGSQEYNLALSQKRAQEVQNYFTKNGVNSSKIFVDFQGESNLVSDDLADESKRQNRRVTIVAEAYKYDDLKSMVSQLESNNTDHKTIDQTQSSTINLSKGTEVKIPEHAFCHLDGSPLENGVVDITFKEAFDYTAMIDESLFTQTADQWLETGGMIYIDASQNGKPVRLKEGANIELLFPKQEQKDGMELFLGVEDENGTIWEEIGQEITSVVDKKDMPMINVDLSPILDFKFKDYDTLGLSFSKMIPYPHPARIAYPPYKENYTEEGYKEAYEKYEAVMAAHELDKIDRPERLIAWTKEAKRRKKAIYEHKRNYIRSQVIDRVKMAIVRLEGGKDKVSHDRLVEVLFSFLKKDVGRVGYDQWYYVKNTFGAETQEVRDVLGLDFPYYERMESGDMVRDFIVAIKQVKENIADRKIELGIIDKNIMSQYLVRTSQLGWINCDKFYNYPKEEMMELEFASLKNVDQYYLIFKDIKSLIGPEKRNGSIIFSGIPRGEDVRLVALDVNDGIATLAVQDLTLGSGIKVNLNAAPAELKDLKRALEI